MAETRILIVDDDRTIAFLCRHLLERAGYEVVVKNQPVEALQQLSAQPFDLLLTDIRMPVMDGIALAHAAARNHPDVTIVLMTGYADQRERAHGLDALIHDVIIKPFSLGAMRRAVNDALCAPSRRGH